MNLLLLHFPVLFHPQGSYWHITTQVWIRVQQNGPIPPYAMRTANYFAFEKFPPKSESWILWAGCALFFFWWRFEFRGFPDGLNRLMPLLETVASRNLKIHLAAQRGCVQDAIQRDPLRRWMWTNNHSQGTLKSSRVAAARAAAINRRGCMGGRIRAAVLEMENYCCRDDDL